MDVEVLFPKDVFLWQVNDRTGTVVIHLLFVPLFQRVVDGQIRQRIGIGVAADTPVHAE